MSGDPAGGEVERPNKRVIPASCHRLLTKLATDRSHGFTSSGKAVADLWQRVKSLLRAIPKGQTGHIVDAFGGLSEAKPSSGGIR
jgi:hypothetical protein